MAGRISERVIQQILDRVNLVELIGEQVKLRQAGRNWVGLCPFHADGKPSFSVNPEKGFYYCFGCHEGGNAVSYLMKARGMQYRDAIERLAQSTGVELEFEQGDRASWDRERKHKQQLLAVNREAHSYFRSALLSSGGSAGLSYLSRRGIDREMISHFQVGFAPRGSGFYDRCVAKGLPLNLAAELGLIVKSRRSGEYVDKLGSRVIFPVLTVTDEVAGFSGRTLPDGPDPKYLNSPDSEVFRKGELLFGLVQAREQMKKRDEALLVEGQLDVIALHQAGLANAVAPLGTALTEHQAAVIRRFTKNVTVCFDGDDAGRKASWRAMTVLMNAGLYGKVVSLPDGEDPDSILRQEGADALATRVGRARPFLEYAVGRLVQEAGSDLHGRTVAARKGMEFAGTMSNAIDRQVFTEQLASELGLSPGALRVEASNAAAPGVSGEPTVTKVRDVPSRERSLLQFVFMQPELVRMVTAEDVFEMVETAALKKFFLQMLDEFEEFGRVDKEELLRCTADPVVRDICAELMLTDDELPEATVRRAVSDIVNTLRRTAVRQQQQSLRREVKRAETRGDLDEAFSLMRKMDVLEQELAALADSRQAE